jgi:acyl-CoA synthetase (AMP-forming)/AMP-acid ligase II
MADPAPDLLSLLRRTKGRTSPAVLRCGDEVWPQAEFAARVEAVAAALIERGLAPGDRVAVLLPRSLAEAAVVLAAAAAGAIAVPVHGKLKDAQVQHVLRDAEPRFVVTAQTRLVALRAPAEVLAGQQVLDWERDLVRAPTALLPAAPPSRAPAVLLYTSGSTGLAKGIVQDHHNLALGAAIVSGYLGLAADDRILALLPFSFDYGLNQLLSALHVGCDLVAADHLSAGELALLLRTHRPTTLAGVPSLWHEVAAGLAGGALTDADGASLRRITNSGGALRASDSSLLRRRWPHVAVFAMYGLTEAFRSAFLPPAEFDAFPESFGRALPGVELLLVCPETGRVLDGPATGELVHAGALVAHGYWRNAAATAVRFRPDPRGVPGTVVHSGDLVRRDEGGRLYFVGRRDRLLKVQGHRVSPDEVAAAVAGMPGVGEVWVFGLDGDADGHRIVLWVGGDPDDAELPVAVLRRCRARLPSYMVPTIVRVAASLPHNQNGKVDEEALRRLTNDTTN